MSDDPTFTPDSDTGSFEPPAPPPESDGVSGAEAGTASDAKGVGGPLAHEAELPAGAEPRATSDARPAQAKLPRRKPRDPAVARAFRAGYPVDGKVEKVIKGGYEVQVGRCRGFCPHSQMDLHRVDTPEEHLGKSYKFRILQMRHGGDDVVVSRRALLEADRVEEAKAVRATLIEGTITEGRVARLADFGAFVDLGAGVTGLVHVSEIGLARVVNASDALTVGERVSVRVLKLDGETGRISLSIRQAQDDPWKVVADRFKAGQVYPGTVTRLADFGAFIELTAGVEALASAREFPPSAAGWRDGLEPGTALDWLVISVDAEHRRMSLAPAVAQGIPSAPVRLEPGSKLHGRIQKVEKFGVFVWLGPGQVGLVPNAWTGTARGTDLSRQFPVGKEVEVTLVEVADGGRRIRLTMDEAATAASDEPAPRRPHSPSARPDARTSAAPRERHERQEQAPAQPAASFGTNLGDALKSALERNRGRDS
ncbi:MAG: S1 RNA-binding domain-containing protein [Acidobacteriia bacterium]|nr:S1 RNA-binding domain-containing protein [Terriglobia bacterium]